MIFESDLLVHVNFKEFSCGRSVSGDFNIRPIGPQLRVSSVEVLRERTHGLHRFSCNKFVP